ncbi:ABC transporter permease [Christensenellaceae bacterium OttesenSCG-928-K19]|nr:ABC transporter permease [Christensenellaceae bacterium OttesenSCG-928-K19]
MGNNQTTLAQNFKKAMGGKSIYIIAIIFCVVLAFATPLFATQQNIINIMLQMTIVGIAALGQTYVIITGGIDLSVGAMITFAGCVSIDLLLRYGMWVAIVGTLALGILFGFINGFIVAKARIEPFITTMAMSMIIKSIMLVYTDGYPRYVREGVTEANPNFGDDFLQIGGGKVFGGLPVPFLILVIAAVVLGILLSKTRFGRYVYAVGGNKETARLSGINVPWTQIRVYIICGLTAALAGVVYAARIGTAQTTMGDGYELKAVASVAIGGTPLAGGRGSIDKTIVGALIYTVIANGLNLLGVSSYYQDLATGIIILVAVIINERSLRKQ